MSNTAKLSARDRIETLLDENSFVEIGALVTKRSTDFNLPGNDAPGDGVITGYGLIDERVDGAKVVFGRSKFLIPLHQVVSNAGF